MTRLFATIALVLAGSTAVAGGMAQAADRSSFGKGMPGLAAGHDTPTRPGVVSITYHYVYDRADETGSGASGDFLVAQPAVPSPDQHSLAELAVESADTEQIVEEGWTVDPGQFGDTLPHLFVFHWVDGAATCYNGCGFVTTSSTVGPGMVLAPGAHKVFRINHAHGRWNVLLGRTHVGYFPDSLWDVPFSATAVTQWFGEVAAGSDPPCAQMGDGLFANDADADTITDMTVLGGAAVSATPVKTDPAYYTGKATSGDSMRFGGPGGCGKQPQTIVFVSSPPHNAVVGGPTYTPEATGGGSGNPVVFSIAPSAAGVCVLDAGDVSFVGPGKCVIQANQAGNAAFTPAARATQKFRVRRRQTITFTSIPPAHAHVGGKHYRVRAIGGQSGKPVVLSIAPPARHVCELHRHHRVAFTGKGTCSIHAHQAGNSTYAPAHPKRQTFHVAKR